MDTDSHGSETKLTEAVFGSAFELINVLGPEFLERSACISVNPWLDSIFSILARLRFPGQPAHHLILEPDKPV